MALLKILCLKIIQKVAEVTVCKTEEGKEALVGITFCAVLVIDGQKCPV